MSSKKRTLSVPGVNLLTRVFGTSPDTTSPSPLGAVEAHSQNSKSASWKRATVGDPSQDRGASGYYGMTNEGGVKREKSPFSQRGLRVDTNVDKKKRNSGKDRKKAAREPLSGRSITSGEGAEMFPGSLGAQKGKGCNSSCDSGPQELNGPPGSADTGHFRRASEVPFASRHSHSQKENKSGKKHKTKKSHSTSTSTTLSTSPASDKKRRGSVTTFLQSARQSLSLGINIGPSSSSTSSTTTPASTKQQSLFSHRRATSSSDSAGTATTDATSTDPSPILSLPSKAYQQPLSTSPVSASVRATAIAAEKTNASAAKRAERSRRDSKFKERERGDSARNMGNTAGAAPPGGVNSAGTSEPTGSSSFRVGTWEDRNRKCRRTMEDTHAYLYNYLEVQPGTATTTGATSGELITSDSGYFAVFDGHAGSFAAEYCGSNMHRILAETIHENPGTPIPELLDQAFMKTDSLLDTTSKKGLSGCTAALAMIRWEDRVPTEKSSLGSQTLLAAAVTAAAASTSGSDKAHKTGTTPESIVHHESRLKPSALRQRVLYTANVGDARIILCRDGKAQRLSYDHKGSDAVEARRITQSGGLILNNRVNGVLAITRALGDHYLQDLVTAHPYTTETVIKAGHDEFMIIACDGLWDVCTDQDAVDLIRNVEDPQQAAKDLVEHALDRFSTDNLSCLVVRFLDPSKLGGPGDSSNNSSGSGGVSSPPVTQSDVDFTPTSLDAVVAEESK